MTYQTRSMDYEAESTILGALRYQVFVEQLHWVHGDQLHKVELDDLDQNAHHLGVLAADGQLVGYTRILHGRNILLQQPAFNALLTAASGLVLSETIAEVSRMCIRPDLQKRAGARSGLVITQLLFRAIYDYTSVNNIGQILAIVGDADAHRYSHKAFLMKLLPFSVASGPVLFPAGDLVYLLSLDVATALQDLKVQRLLGLSE